MKGWKDVDGGRNGYCQGGKERVVDEYCVKGTCTCGERRNEQAGQREREKERKKGSGQSVLWLGLRCLGSRLTATRRRRCRSSSSFSSSLLPDPPQRTQQVPGRRDDPTGTLPARRTRIPLMAMLLSASAARDGLVVTGRTRRRSMKRRMMIGVIVAGRVVVNGEVGRGPLEGEGGGG
jgi:hypothetical protein